MKTNFAKKIIKILTIATLSVFVLTLFNFEMVYAKAAYSVEETTYSDGGYEVKKTTTIYEDEKGKEITRVEEVPTDTSYGNGTVKESYTDNTGVEHTRNGYIDKNGNYSWDSDNWYTADEFSGSATEDNTVSSTDGEKFTYTLLQELPKEGEPLKTNVTLKEYLTWAFRFTLALAGFLAVMMIVIGGVEYIISGANESSRSDAKKRINNAISGLVLALVSYLVLYTINPSLVDFNNNQFFKEKTTSSSDSNENNTETNNEDNSSSEGDYSSTGAALTSEEKNTSSVNAEGYDVSKNVIITNHEDGSESYAITETYTDKDGNIYTTRTTKDKEDVFSTKKYVQYIGQSEETLISEDESNPNYDFSGWDGS